MRLFKLFRYSKSIRLFSDVLATKRVELYTLLIFMSFLVFIASTAIFMFENHKNGGQISDFFEAIYWAVVTISTVGYGDISPQTPSGQAIAMLLIISGLGLLSFFTSIIVSAFTEKMPELHENRIYTELSHCHDYKIICGFGRVGQEVARQFHKDKMIFVIIDNNNKHIKIAKRLGYLAIHADATKNEVLNNTGINKGANTLLCTTGNDVINLYITLTGRHLNPEINIITRANHDENSHKLKQAGANHVIHPFEITGLLAAGYLGQPVAFEMILGIVEDNQQISLSTLLVTEHSGLDNKSVQEIEFSSKKLILMGVISHNSKHKTHRHYYKVKSQHFYFNPDSHFILRTGDILLLLGHPYSLEHFHNHHQLEKSRVKMSLFYGR